MCFVNFKLLNHSFTYNVFQDREIYCSLPNIPRKLKYIRYKIIEELYLHSSFNYSPRDKFYEFLIKVY